MTEPNYHKITLPNDDHFVMIIDINQHHELITRVARFNGVRYSTKTKAATPATEHLLPIVESIPNLGHMHIQDILSYD